MPRIRQRADGGLWVAKSDIDIENSLNAQFQRDGNTWYPHPSGKTVESLKNTAKDQTANIVGKGPSIGRIQPGDFVGGPIICVNQSIHLIDKMDPMLATFCIQSDGTLMENCRPRNATLLLGTGARGWYGDLKNRIIFDPVQDLHAEQGTISAVYALYFAKLMGCKGALMLCFDAAVTKDLSYAQEFGAVAKYPNEKQAGDRFLKHKKKIEETAKKLLLKLDWKCPK